MFVIPQMFFEIRSNLKIGKYHSHTGEFSHVARLRSAHARGLVPATSLLKSSHEGTRRRD